MRDYKALMKASRKALGSDPNSWSGHYFLAVSHDGLGRLVDAIPEYQRAVELSRGDKNRAFEFLEKGYRERSPDIPYFLKTDLRLDLLRADPRFLELVRRVGLAQ
jgi:tetratricopeptide (TPR) repeat protein